MRIRATALLKFLTGIGFLVVMLESGGNVWAQSRLYWTENGNGGLVRAANLDGSGVTNVMTGAGDLRGMATDSVSGKVYTSTYEGHIAVANLDGSGRHTLLLIGSEVSSLSLDTANNWMYWTDYDADRIERAHLDGSGRQTVLSLTLFAEPLSIVVDTRDSKLYWTEVDRNFTPTIRRSNLDGSGIENLVTRGLQYPATLQLDLRDNQMYWADTHGSIQRSTLDGAGVQTLISGLDVPEGLALDLSSDKMYFSEYYSGAISSANLDGTGVQSVLNGTPNGGLDEVAIVVPEPTSLAALSIGCFVVSVSTRRRTRRR